MGSHNSPKISRRRSESKTFRIKAYSVEMDAIQALQSDLSPHQPYPDSTNRWCYGGSQDTFQASPMDEMRKDPKDSTQKGLEQATFYLLSWCPRKERKTLSPLPTFRDLQGGQCEKASLIVFCFSYAICPTYKQVHKIKSS